MKDSYVFYTDKLGAEYRKAFDQIELYVNTQRVDEPTKEERMNELLDIFLSAEEAGKPVERVVGNDIEAFCKAFCSEFDRSHRLLSFFDGLRSIAKTFVAVSLIDAAFLFFDWLDGAEIDLLKSLTSLNTSGFLLAILLSATLGFLSNLIVRRIMFRRKRISMKVLKAIPLTVVVVAAFASLALVFWEATNFITCPVWLVFLIGALYLAVYYSLSYKRLRRDKREKVRFTDMVQEGVNKNFPEEMEKKYARANARSIKRGKGELSIEDFLQKEEKECASTEKSGWFYYLFPIVITAVLTLASEFDAIVDLLIYVGIMLALEYSVMLWFWKIAKTGVKQRRAWIASKREELEKTKRESE